MVSKSSLRPCARLSLLSASNDLNFYLVVKNSIPGGRKGLPTWRLAVERVIGGNREIGGDGDQTTSLATVELVHVLSPSVLAAVDTAAKVPGVEEKSRSCI